MMRPPTESQMRAVLRQREKARARRREMIRGAILAGLAVLAAVVVFALMAGCDNQTDGKFKSDCRAKGGTPQITHRDGSTTRLCHPPAGGRL